MEDVCDSLIRRCVVVCVGNSLWTSLSFYLIKSSCRVADVWTTSISLPSCCISDQETAPPSLVSTLRWWFGCGLVLGMSTNLPSNGSPFCELRLSDSSTCWTSCCQGISFSCRSGKKIPLAVPSKGSSGSCLLVTSSSMAVINSLLSSLTQVIQVITELSFIFCG